MKPTGSTLVLAAALAAASTATAQEVALTPSEQKAADMRLPELDRSALIPEKREPEKVLEGERNPFGLVSLPPEEEEEEVESIQTETEEMRLRRILLNMRISGLSGSEGSYRVMLGPMSLIEGDILPRLFTDQAEVLRVTKITDRELQLSFLEKDPNLPPRTIGLGFDLRPRPQALLAGELFKKLVPFTPKGLPELEPIELPSVQAVTEGAKAANFGGLIERSSELMGETGYQPSYASPPAEKED